MSLDDYSRSLGLYLKAGLLTEQHLHNLPTSQWKQWYRGGTSYSCLTAAGTVPDFHRIPFTIRQVKYRMNSVKPQKTRRVPENSSAHLIRS